MQHKAIKISTNEPGSGRVVLTKQIKAMPPVVKQSLSISINPMKIDR